MADDWAGLRIGILSDTHGLLRPEALEHLRGADHIIHAGDIGASGIIETLEAIAPTTAIRGNVDTAFWAARFSETVTIHFAGLRIHVLHDRKALDPSVLEDGVAVVISGHSHRPGIESSRGVLFLNPGSAGPRRFRLPVTAATLHLGPSGLRPEIRAILPQRLARARHPTVEFWYAVALMTGRYRGRPIQAHGQLGIKAADFDRRLDLFRTTAREIGPRKRLRS